METNNSQTEPQIINPEPVAQPVDPTPAFTPEPPSQPIIQPVQVKASKTGPLLGFIIGGIVFGAIGFFVGTMYDQYITDSDYFDIAKKPAATPEIIIPVESTLPEIESTPISTMSAIVKTVTVPELWGSFTASDTDFKVKTSLSLPPESSFKFSGSEVVLMFDSAGNESWELATSVYRDGTETLKNHYDGSSRRAWYTEWLKTRDLTATVVNVEEKPLNETTYLQITVQVANYDAKGQDSGFKNVTHFVYVQNGILHVLRPYSEVASSPQAKMLTNIEPILVSLNSEIIN